MAVLSRQRARSMRLVAAAAANSDSGGAPPTRWLPLGQSAPHKNTQHTHTQAARSWHSTSHELGALQCTAQGQQLSAMDSVACAPAFQTITSPIYSPVI